MDKESNVAYAIHAGSAVISMTIVFCSNLGAAHMGIITTAIMASFFFNARFRS